MHQTAMEFGRLFFQTYVVQTAPPKIVEIGSCDVNGSLRSLAPAGSEYIGLDCQAGPGVDLVLDDPYAFPITTASQDFVLSSSCFEHADMFWLLFLEAMRILKPEGILYLNAPSNGDFHRYPTDSWRFYPDAGRALAAWGRRSGFKTHLLESLIGPRPMDGAFNDFVAVFIRDGDFVDRFPLRMMSSLKVYGNGCVDEIHQLQRPISRW